MNLLLLQLPAESEAVAGGCGAVRLLCSAVFTSTVFISTCAALAAAPDASGVFRIFRNQLRLSVHTFQKKASAPARPLPPRFDGGGWWARRRCCFF